MGVRILTMGCRVLRPLLKIPDALLKPPRSRVGHIEYLLLSSGGFQIDSRAAH